MSELQSQPRIGLFDSQGRYAGSRLALPTHEEMRLARAAQKRRRQTDRQRKGMKPWTPKT